MKARVLGSRVIHTDDTQVKLIDHSIAGTRLARFWGYLGSERAGHRAAILTSLIASCKNNLVEPWAYLKDIFDCMARGPSEAELTDLLPNVWLNANPDQRWEIAEIRRNERM